MNAAVRETHITLLFLYFRQTRIPKHKPLRLRLRSVRKRSPHQRHGRHSRGLLHRRADRPAEPAHQAVPEPELTDQWPLCVAV